MRANAIQRRLESSPGPRSFTDGAGSFVLDSCACPMAVDAIRFVKMDEDGEGIVPLSEALDIFLSLLPSFGNDMVRRSQRMPACCKTASACMKCPLYVTLTLFVDGFVGVDNWSLQKKLRAVIIEEIGADARTVTKVQCCKYEPL